MPSLESWVDIANIGVVAALALSFVFGGASIFLSRRLSKQRDAQSAREKLASDEKVEAAKADAVRANTEAVRIESEGKERVAKVEAEAKEKIAELTTEAERAKAERAEADKQIEIAKADVTKAARQTAEISLRVEEEARKRAEAEKALLELQERVKPRHLTAQQRKQLIEVLKKNPSNLEVINCVLADAESCAFATELNAVFKEAGWTTGGVVSFAFAFMTEVPVGLEVWAQGFEPAPPQVGIIDAAFKSAGLRATGRIDPSRRVGQIKLIVGAKP